MTINVMTQTDLCPLIQANIASNSDERDLEGVAVMLKRLSSFETKEGRLKGFSYQPGPRDVAISTTPKAGTTWMQQICHQLRTGGNMDFSEISEVVPWLELANDQGQVLEDAQYGDSSGELRFFKTHAWAGHCPDFSKNIVVLRNPCDVLVSFYHFFEGWFFEAGSLSLKGFAEKFWLKRGVPENQLVNASCFVHLVSWYERRKETDRVLLVFYEDLKSDLEGEVTRVAEFLSSLDDRYKDPARIEAAVSYSTFAFMKAHEGHFDEKLSKSRNSNFSLPDTAGRQSSKIRRGESGVGESILDDDVRKQIQDKWISVVAPVTGCANYEDFHRHLSEERAKGLIS